VLADVREGYVSVAAARTDYGVVVEGGSAGYRIDPAETSKLRAARAGAALVSS
jgi:hypothetical protein